MVLLLAGASYAAPPKPTPKPATTPAPSAAPKVHFPVPTNLPPAKEAPKILVVLSDNSTITLKNGKKAPTGYSLNQLMIPAMALMDMGYSIYFATPKGKAPTMDPISDQMKFFASPDQYKKVMKERKTLFAIREPLSFRTLDKMGLDQFKALLVPGEYAPMTDLVKNREFGLILKHFHVKQKPTALISHGAAALLAAATVDKNKKIYWPYKGYKMTVFSNLEEKEAESVVLGGLMPFYAETEMTKAGAILSLLPKGKPNAVKDRELITGQNSEADKAFTELLVNALKKK